MAQARVDRGAANQGLSPLSFENFPPTGDLSTLLTRGQLCLERKEVPADCAKDLLAKHDTVCFCPHCRNLTCGSLEAATGRTEFRAR